MGKSCDQKIAAILFHDTYKLVVIRCRYHFVAIDNSDGHLFVDIYFVKVRVSLF